MKSTYEFLIGLHRATPQPGKPLPKVTIQLRGAINGMIRLIGIVLIATLILAFDCTNDGGDECLEQFIPIEIDSFYYSEPATGSVQLCSLQNVDPNRIQTDIVIESQADFEKYVDCVHMVSIDFSQKTVFAGAVWTNGGSFAGHMEVLKKCDAYVYHVDIKVTPPTTPTLTRYFAIVPKISSRAKVTFEVIVPD